MDITLNVNGRPEQFSAQPNELLVERLRDGLGLTGTKVGCDTGQCGTCVVQLDGRSVKSCLILTASAMRLRGRHHRGRHHGRMAN